MKATVARAISPRPIDKDGIVDWANRELQPVLSQMRLGLNAQIIERQEGITDGGGTFLQVWASEAMPTDAAWTVYASVAGTSNDAGGGKHASYLLAASASSTAGVVALGSQSVLFDFETDAACDASFIVVDRKIVLQVRDDGVSAMRFASAAYIMEARRQ